MTHHNIQEGSSIIWQYFTEMDTKLNGESSLIISPYSDVISIIQEDNSININWDTLPELIKALQVHLKNHNQ